MVVLIALAGVGLAVSADFRSSDWPMRRALKVSAAPEIYAVPLDLDVQSRARPDLLDVRIVGNGRVEPFTVVRGKEPEIVATIANPPGKIDSELKASVFTVDLGRPLPFERIDVGIVDKVYNRVTRVEVSQDRKSWKFASTGYIFRTFTDAQTAFSVGMHHARYVRLYLVNNDNIPLQCHSLTFSLTRRELQFVAHGPGPFWMYYGAPGVRPALYDETEIRAYREKGDMQLAQVGAAERNPAFHVNPLAQGDQAYEERLRAIIERVKWVGVGVIALFALLYLGYLVLENKPKPRRSRRRRRRSSEGSGHDVYENSGIPDDHRIR